MFYEEHVEDLKRYLKEERSVGSDRLRDYINVLTNKLYSKIFTPKDLVANLDAEYTDTFPKALKNIFNYMGAVLDMEEFNGVLIEKWQKAIRIRSTGIREIYVTDAEVKEAYMRIRNKPLFKLLVYSGCRFSQGLEGLKNLSKVVLLGDICRIPIYSTSKGKKRAYWLYIPAEFLSELKEVKSSYERTIRYGRVSAVSLRKWNLNKMIVSGVQESVADFIQGRASITVGSAHYMNLTNLADREYVRISPELKKVLGEGGG